MHPWMQRSQPCATCPYRRETKLALWSEAEFVDLKKNDRAELGSPVYACHGDMKLAPKDRGPCIGWLLDQKRRGVPSIRLRLALLDEVACDAFNGVSDDGLDLYDSIEQMHRANFPKKRRRRS